VCDDREGDDEALGFDVGMIPLMSQRGISLLFWSGILDLIERWTRMTRRDEDEEMVLVLTLLL
jgi:hypothetical protein